MLKVQNGSTVFKGILINLFPCVCLSPQHLTGWSNMPLGLNSRWWGGTSWLHLTWRGSLGSLEGYTHCTHCRAEQQFEYWSTADLLDTINSSLDEEVFCNSVVFTIRGTALLYKQLMVTDSFTTTCEWESKFTSAVESDTNSVFTAYDCMWKSFNKWQATFIMIMLYVISGSKKKSKHVGLICTEYLPWINVAGSALPSTTFALAVRLPFTNQRAVYVWQRRSSRFAFNAEPSTEYSTVNVAVCCAQCSTSTVMNVMLSGVRRAQNLWMKSLLMIKEMTSLDDVR